MAGEIEEGAKAETGEIGEGEVAEGRGRIGGNFLDWPYSESQLAAPHSFDLTIWPPSDPHCFQQRE